MYQRLYYFLNENNILYGLQFGVRLKFSTNHLLVNVTENFKQALDDGFIVCGMFVDLLKACNTVDLNILIAILDHYGICGIACNWFRSYPSNPKQYVSINSFNSRLASISYDVP